MSIMQTLQNRLKNTLLEVNNKLLTYNTLSIILFAKGGFTGSLRDDFFHSSNIFFTDNSPSITLFLKQGFSGSLREDFFTDPYKIHFRF